jgi:hypothetical protein
LRRTHSSTVAASSATWLGTWCTRRRGGLRRSAAPPMSWSAPCPAR